MNQSEYREELRKMSTAAIVAEMEYVRDHLRGVSRGYDETKITDEWQARELLAELGSRQLHLFEG